MRALQRKLWRDLWHLRGQVTAIGLVVACGVATVVTTRTAYDSLVISRAAYYAQYRFADVFASLKRAPEALAREVEKIPGVAAVHTRVVFEVTLDVPGLREPATGRLVSIPERRVPILNDLHLRSGRWIEPGRRDEALASEAFAKANRLREGDAIGAVLNGRWQQLRIVGIALTPEYVYEIRGTDVFPDNKRFGVLWMSREAMGPAFEMDGAFNDVVLALAPGASESEVIARLDRLLARWGGLGANGRDDQISHRFLSDEIAQNRITGTVVPAIFLGVAAFLLNVVLRRLVATQRDQIAVLKAFGYSNTSVAWHYLGLALVAVAGGVLLGSVLGLWWGRAIHRLYVDFYRFAVWGFEAGPATFALAVGVAALAALLGALGAVRSAVALPPAEAMRPEAPARFRSGALERVGLRALLSPAARMLVRNLARRPGRAALSTLGMALAVALLVVGRFFLDSVGALAEVQFRVVQRDDATLAFHEPLPSRARFDLAHLPGVLRAEPWRAVPTRLRFEHRSKRTALLGLAPGTELRRLVDASLEEVALPPEGLVLTRRLGEILGVEPGDEVSIEILEGERAQRSARIAGFVDELIGLAAYMDADALARLLRESGSVSGAWLRIDAREQPQLYAELKRTPAVAGVMLKGVLLQSFEDTLARSLGVFNTVLVSFACVIAFAMVYNTARIALSERGRELASLRVLGFTQTEVTQMLLGEQALLVGLAIPFGLAIGYLVSAWIVEAYQWELFRLPFVVSARTCAFAVLVTVFAALGSGLVVGRRLARLDLVAVLKTRE
ncbi:MAG TPA: FtsX-like permease family protein [Myxococcota bacterium]|nr:FtsX-like permease family protein [Myxococcota bacterium]